MVHEGNVSCTYAGLERRYLRELPQASAYRVQVHYVLSGKMWSSTSDLQPTAAANLRAGHEIA